MNISFGNWNRILGWTVFSIALIVYTLTLEPTTSYWDAGEYIATAANLEVGHPPGAPLYQMLGAFFAVFATGAETVAWLVNFMSALSSAFTVMFLFWSVVLLFQKITGPPEQFATAKRMAALGSAFTGALAFTFTDSFWFNAVEAEVYAMSTCFMALLFYLGLLWERDIFTPRGNRWLILISFIIGLSFGVHFLTLLSIPAIGLLYYFKTYNKITFINFIVANVLVVIVLLFIFKLLLPCTLSFLATSEIFFTNTIGLPFNSGTIIAIIIIISIFYFGLIYSRTKRYVQLNTMLLCILFILIGFSSWSMLPIRANANTVINENRPDDARELLAYYNREQYGELPLIYGPQFTEMYSGLDPENPYKDEPPNYEKDYDSGKYVVINDYKNARHNFDDKHKTILPRMWSREHAANYLLFTGGLDFNVKREYQGEDQLAKIVADFRQGVNSGEIGRREYHSFLNQFREYLEVERPSFAANINYMLEYQMGYMYWRYFLWNFVGRQNDLQGKYTDLNGNWLSGINFIDEPRVGPQDNLPSDIAENKARNTYFFLPLLLGLIGMVFHYKRDKKRFWVLLVFFLFAGIALKVYLNEYPFQVRERDYALVGSFYVFSLWIGIGTYAIFTSLKKIVNPAFAAPITVAVSVLAVPALLATQNWDDHDRSNRYSALAMAKMYLDSVDENAILFTIGDNDTFLLWYAQQIEGYRRDVRIVNTMLLNTDWYIDQMKRKAWKSEPLPSQLKKEQFRAGTNDILLHQPGIADTLNINTWMDWVTSDHPGTIAKLQNGRRVKTFPSMTISVPVNKEKVLRNDIVEDKEEGEIVDVINIELQENVIYKNQLLMLDILANNNWERPIYFSGGSFGDEDYLWMKDYLQLDGLAYKIVPIHTPVDANNPLEMGRINADKMYAIVMDWDWGNIGNSNIYHDPETRRNTITYRTVMARLVEALLKEGSYNRAEEIINLALEQMPPEYYDHYFLYEPFISGYFKLGEKGKAMELWDKVAAKYRENLKYYSNWNRPRQYENAELIISDLEQYQSLVRVLFASDQTFLGKEKTEEFNRYRDLFSHFYMKE